MAKNKGQQEFANMPERSELGKTVIEYLNCKNDLDKAKEALENAKNVAVEHFLASSKKSITVNGRIVSYSHVGKDKITVKGD